METAAEQRRPTLDDPGEVPAVQIPQSQPRANMAGFGRTFRRTLARLSGPPHRKWRTLLGLGRGPISGRGRWLQYLSSDDDRFSGQNLVMRAATERTASCRRRFPMFYTRRYHSQERIHVWNNFFSAPADPLWSRWQSIRNTVMIRVTTSCVFVPEFQTFEWVRQNIILPSKSQTRADCRFACHTLSLDSCHIT